MQIKKLIVFIVLVNISMICFAQEFSLGAKVGFGSSTYKKQSDGEKTSKYFTQKYGLSLEFTPYFSRFLILSGTEFEFNNIGNTMMIPLSLRVVFGENFRIFIEGGGYYDFSLKSKTEKYTLKNDLGVRAGFGLQYKIGRNWIIETAYIGKFGFTPQLEEAVYLPGNQIDYEKYRISLHQIELSVIYRF